MKKTTRRILGIVTTLMMLIPAYAIAVPPSHAGGPPAHVCEKNPGHWSCGTTTTVPDSTTTTTAPTTSTTVAPSTTTTVAPTTTTSTTTTSTTSSTTTSTTTTTVPPTTTTTTTPSSCSGTNVTPSTDLQAAFNSAGQNGTLCFAPGTYNISGTTARPLSGQKLISTVRRGAIIDGNNTAQLWFNGEGAPNLTVQGFVIRNFNVGQTPGYAALKGSRGFRVIDNEIHHNDGAGLYHAEDSYIAHNEFHHNSHVGFGGFKAHRTQVIGNEVYENGFNSWSDNSGSKHVGAIEMVFRDNYYHHNYRNSLWLDADHVNAIIENNRVEDNYGKGIHFEISCSGEIRNNSIQRNGNVGLLIVASQNTNAYGNTIAGNVYDIEIWDQVRAQPGTQNCNAWILDNVKVYDNDITISEEESVRIRHCCGGTEDVYDANTTKIRFDNNRYVIDGVALPFQHRWQFITAAEWVNRGQDPNSTFTIIGG